MHMIEEPSDRMRAWVKAVPINGPAYEGWLNAKKAKIRLG